MNLKAILLTFFILFVFTLACKKDKNLFDEGYVYYQVGFRSNPSDWRDTAFIVRTGNQQLIQQIETQLALPVAERKLIVGTLAKGSAGYNRNGSHEFKWHLQEDAWNIADVTIEIYDGTPYSEVDQNIDYWLNTVKTYGPWSSYIRKKLPGRP
jgi:hypothetical protein